MNDPGELSAIVKRKPAQVGSKWRREIDGTGRKSPVKASEYEFLSMSTAKQVADKALISFLQDCNNA